MQLDMRISFKKKVGKKREFRENRLIDNYAYGRK
jgi:hypothetical protein